MGRPVALALAALVVTIAVALIVIQQGTGPMPTDREPPASDKPAEAPDREATGTIPSPGQRPAASALVSVSDAFAYPASAGAASSAAFFTMANEGPAQELVAVTASRARAAELKQDGGRQALQTIAIPAFGRVVLKPGGPHVALSGLDGPLVAGDDISLVLEFGDGSRLEVTVPVSDAGL
jgi:hypothetical protein